MNFIDIINHEVKDADEKAAVLGKIKTLNLLWTSYLKQHGQYFNKPASSMDDSELKRIVDEDMFSSLRGLNNVMEELYGWKFDTNRTIDSSIKLSNNIAHFRNRHYGIFYKLKGDIYEAHSIYLNPYADVPFISREWYSSVQLLYRKMDGLASTDPRFNYELWLMHSGVNGLKRKIDNAQKEMINGYSAPNLNGAYTIMNRFSREFEQDAEKLISLTKKLMRLPFLDENDKFKFHLDKYKEYLGYNIRLLFETSSKIN